MPPRRCRHPVRAFLLASALAWATGCGFPRIELPIPAEIPNATLEAIREIQNDPTLTLMEQQEAIRELVGAPMTPEGDLLVNLLLNLNIP